MDFIYEIILPPIIIWGTVFVYLQNKYFFTKTIFSKILLTYIVSGPILILFHYSVFLLLKKGFWGPCSDWCGVGSIMQVKITIGLMIISSILLGVKYLFYPIPDSIEATPNKDQEGNWKFKITWLILFLFLSKILYFGIIAYLNGQYYYIVMNILTDPSLFFLVFSGIFINKLVLFGRIILYIGVILFFTETIGSTLFILLDYFGTREALLLFSTIAQFLYIYFAFGILHKSSAK